MSALRVVVAICSSLALDVWGKVDVSHTAEPVANRPGFVRDVYRGRFDSCSVNVEHVKRGPYVSHEVWEDYFFGLDFDDLPKNGGWSKWNFIRVYVRLGTEVANVLERASPDVFFGYSLADADFLVAEWRMGGGGCVRLFFLVLESYPDWMFVRVEQDRSRVEKVVLSAYPGSAGRTKGRERCIATRRREWTLGRIAAEIAPDSSPILLYSRYADDDFGNKLVYDGRMISSIRAPRTEACVDLVFVPKPDADAIVFALGNFRHCRVDGQKTRFLGEEGDAVVASLRSIDWTAMPSEKTFDLSVRIARMMGVPIDQLDCVVDEYREAVRANDISAIATAFDSVISLRRQRADTGLNEFR